MASKRTPPPTSLPLDLERNAPLPDPPGKLHPQKGPYVAPPPGSPLLLRIETAERHLDDFPCPGCRDAVGLFGAWRRMLARCTHPEVNQDATGHAECRMCGAEVLLDHSGRGVCRTCAKPTLGGALHPDGRCDECHEVDDPEPPAAPEPPDWPPHPSPHVKTARRALTAPVCTVCRRAMASGDDYLAAADGPRHEPDCATAGERIRDWYDGWVAAGSASSTEAENAEPVKPVDLPWE